MKNLLILLVLLLLNACSPKLKQSFKKLSKPERTWVTFHVFKAKKAYIVSLEAERVKDSMAKIQRIGQDNNGGLIDAFKHAFWTARLTQEIGPRAAYSLGKAHEKGNFQTFKNRQLEDGYLADKQATKMDLFNNQVGINTAIAHKNSAKAQLIQQLLDSLEQGKLRILAKDQQGYFLDCEKIRIPLDSLKNKWETKKCLIPSDQ